jgi:hypothetical protein
MSQSVDKLNSKIDIRRKNVIKGSHPTCPLTNFARHVWKNALLPDSSVVAHGGLFS